MGKKLTAATRIGCKSIIKTAKFANWAVKNGFEVSHVVLGGALHLANEFAPGSKATPILDVSRKAAKKLFAGVDKALNNLDKKADKIR